MIVHPPGREMVALFISDQNIPMIIKFTKCPPMVENPVKSQKMAAFLGSNLLTAPIYFIENLFKAQVTEARFTGSI
jgi:hypothetical protein